MSEIGDFSTPSSPSAGPSSYTCPDELYSIPRSIHLARIAAFYSKCRDCPHRSDHGHLALDANQIPRPTDGQPGDAVRRPVVRTSLLTDESVRGVYLNELTRNRAIAWGESLAALLWDQQPLVAQGFPATETRISDESTPHQEKIPFRGPQVVVGFDERPSSPDIVTGVVLGLRRMGCPVIDVGQTSLTILSFHLQATAARAGLFVTGAGCDVSMTGFELLARDGLPFSHADLTFMESVVSTGVGRQTRQIGGHFPVQCQSDYVSSLAGHFHALRPLRVVCGSPLRQTHRILKQIFARLPCELTMLSLPTRKRDLFDPQDTDLQRVAKTVVEGGHHLGLVIDEDCQHCAFLTDQGDLVAVKEVARLLVEIAQRENSAALFVVATSLLPDALKWLQGRDASVADGGETISGLMQSLIDRQATLALAGDGRVCFRSQYIACDALVILANILKALSLSDTPFSEVIDRISKADMNTM